MVTEERALALCAWVAAYRLDQEARRVLDAGDRAGLETIEAFLRTVAVDVEVTARMLRQADELLTGQSVLGRRRAEEIAALCSANRLLEAENTRLSTANAALRERLAPVERLRPAARPVARATHSAQHRVNGGAP